MATNTTNYNFIKPSVNDPTDQDLWGGYLNENWESLDGLLKTASDTIISTKTASYIITQADKNGLVLMDTTSGNLTLTLLDAATAGNGFEVSFKKIAEANTLEIIGTIDGVINPEITADDATKTIVSNGTSWYYKSEYLGSTASTAAETIIQRKFIQSNTTFNSNTLDTFEATGIQFALDNNLATTDNKVRIRVFGYGGVQSSGGNNIYLTVRTGATDLAGSFSALGAFTLDTPNGLSESDGLVPYSMFVERTAASTTPETYEIFSKSKYAANQYYLGRNALNTETLPTTIIIEEVQVNA